MSHTITKYVSFYIECRWRKLHGHSEHDNSNELFMQRTVVNKLVSTMMNKSYGTDGILHSQLLLTTSQCHACPKLFVVWNKLCSSFFFRPIYPHRLITVSEDEWSSCFYTIPVLTYCSYNIADHSIKRESEHVKAVFCEGLDVLQYVDKYALEARDIVAEKRDFHYGCSM